MLDQMKSTKVREQAKNFDQELFQLIKTIKYKEKMHLRKPSTLDNLVLFQRIDEYYLSKKD